MVAPIEEVVAGEMEIDDDGEGEEDASMEEPGDVLPPPQPREVRPSAMRPGEEIVRIHNLTHCPCQSWCTETLRGSRWISCLLVQKEHLWINREQKQQFSC